MPGLRLPSHFVRLICLISLVGIVACQAANPTSEPTAQILQIQTSTTFTNLGPFFQSCTLAQSGLGLVLHDRPAAEFTTGNDLSIRWGEPAVTAGYMAQIGEETLALVISAQNQLSSLPYEIAQQIFIGQLRKWEDVKTACPACVNLPSGDIHLWMFPAEEDASQVLKSVFPGIPDQVQTYAGIVPIPAAMLQMIASDPAAIGSLPRRWLDKSVKEITLTGAQENYFRQPILAISPVEPQGKLRQWLKCLQDKLIP
jgi:hypothetical protein